MDILDRLNSLKSMWGAFSCAAVLFPGATYLFNLASTKTSPLGEFYLATGTPLGALAVFLALAIGDDRARSRRRTYTIVISIVIGIVALGGFVAATSPRHETVSYRGAGECTVVAFGTAGGNGYRTYYTESGGRITRVLQPCECTDTGSMGANCRPTAPEETTVKTAPAEFYALGLFNLCVIALAGGFTLMAREALARKG